MPKDTEEPLCSRCGKKKVDSVNGLSLLCTPCFEYAGKNAATLEIDYILNNYFISLDDLLDTCDEFDDSNVQPHQG